MPRWAPTHALVPKILRLTAGLSVVAMVTALPAIATPAPQVAAEPPAREAVHDPVAEGAPMRALTVARGASVTAAAAPETRVAPEPKRVIEYTLGPADTLQSLASFYGISPEAIAYANGISDPSLANQQGRSIRIPPEEGALYTVQGGDTVESVAQRFGVRSEAVMEWNRLYFEPEHFAPGKLVFVPGATLPGLVYVAADVRVARPTVRPAAAGERSTDETLAWPVAPNVSQPFWAGHGAVDIAAPYGGTIGAAAAGVVTAVGWVPVGGLRACVRTGALEHCYYHTAAVFVGPGQRVERGQAIAAIGLTGVTTGPHVHFEVKRSGALVDPLSLIR